MAELGADCDPADMSASEEGHREKADMDLPIERQRAAEALPAKPARAPLEVDGKNAPATEVIHRGSSPVRDGRSHSDNAAKWSPIRPVRATRHMSGVGAGAETKEASAGSNARPKVLPSSCKMGQGNAHNLLAACMKQSGNTTSPTAKEAKADVKPEWKNWEAEKASRVRKGQKMYQVTSC